jgi:DNA replication protein DnaC
MSKFTSLNMQDVPAFLKSKEYEELHESYKDRFQESLRKARCWVDNVRNNTASILQRQGVSKRHSNACREQISVDIWHKLWKLYVDGKGIFLNGNVGVGKTYSAVALMRQGILSMQPSIVEGGYRLFDVETPKLPKMVTVPDFLSKIRATFKGTSDDSEQSIIDHYSNTQCLCLDDLGQEKSTDWAKEILYILIDHRYRHDKQTLFTSNLSLEEIARRIGDPLASRIVEMCHVEELRGKDKRLFKQWR